MIIGMGSERTLKVGGLLYPETEGLGVKKYPESFGKFVHKKFT